MLRMVSILYNKTYEINDLKINQGLLVDLVIVIDGLVHNTVVGVFPYIGTTDFIYYFNVTVLF